MEGVQVSQSGVKMLTLRSMTLKRLRRCPVVAVIAVFISSIIAVHLYTINSEYSVMGPKWQVTTALPDVTSLGAKVRHVVFVKVHKAASTTLMNMFVRFGLRNNLTLMIPRWKNILNEHGKFNAKNVLPPLRNRTYDMLCNHIIFNKTFIAPLFPNDTKYIGILREPFDQTVSAFMYYKYVYPISYLWRIHGENPVSEYLKDPKKYEPTNPAMSFTNNRMSLDLGFPNVWSRNETEGQAFIKDLENTFQLILIAEYFDESVILMRRLLNWDFKDILYISSNSLKKGHDLKFSPEDRARHEKWAWLDHAVYNHFYQLFWDKVHSQGKNFFREVQTFKNIRRVWQNFCSQKLQSSDVLTIESSQWNNAFQVTSEDCKLATTKEIPLMDTVRMNYYLKIRQRGIVLPYVSHQILNNVFKSSLQRSPVAHHLVQTRGGEWVKKVQTNLDNEASKRGKVQQLKNQTNKKY